jgi:predicted RNA binding protein YcfA (HicA-like mRNA interferase family)
MLLKAGFEMVGGKGSHRIGEDLKDRENQIEGDKTTA